MSKYFVIITGIFITSLLTANIIAVKLIDIFGFVLPAGVVIFPISYIFGDILTEVYGYRLARLVIWLGFLCNLLMVVAIWIAQILPSANFWNNQSAYEMILGYTPRLLVASFIAYLIGEFVNSFVLSRMKIMTKGRFLWSRTIGSTIVGEGLDSLVFIFIAFVGIIPLWGLSNAVLAQWVFKTGYEILITPLTYLVVNKLKHLEGTDVFDHNLNFNPFIIND